MNGRSILAAWSLRPARIVATVGLVAGLGFAVLTPPVTGYDESIHFLRAYQVSQGGLVATHRGHRLGGAIPTELRTDLQRLLTEGLFARHDRTAYLDRLGDRPAGGKKVFIDFPSSGVYSPVPYAPAALFVAIGRAVGVSTLALLYLARFATLFTVVGLLVLAVRRMPARAWVLATVALLPVTVFQAATISADGITIALALLVVALALDVAATPRGRVTKSRLVEIALATLALGFAKPPYILFALALLIPIRRHGGAVARAIVLSLGAGFAATAAWGVYASRVYVAPVLPAGYAVRLTRFTPFTHVDQRRQRSYVLHHPWQFVQAIGRTLSAYGPDHVREALTQVPLWRLPLLAIIAAAGIVIASAFVAEPRSDSLLGWRGRALLLAIAVATFMALMVLAYLGWNAVGSPRIEAFQGRYLLPLVPIVLLAAVPEPHSLGRAGRDGPSGALLGLASAFLLAFVWFGLRSHFY